jgi:hypothetical protein
MQPTCANALPVRLLIEAFVLISGQHSRILKDPVGLYNPSLVLVEPSRIAPIGTEEKAGLYLA